MAAKQSRKASTKQENDRVISDSSNPDLALCDGDPEGPITLLECVKWTIE
jgi:hypothetical protein